MKSSSGRPHTKAMPAPGGSSPSTGGAGAGAAGAGECARAAAGPEAPPRVAPGAVRLGVLPPLPQLWGLVVMGLGLSLAALLVADRAMPSFL